MVAEVDRSCTGASGGSSMSDIAVPSMTLSITRDDVVSVIDASQALRSAMKTMQKCGSSDRRYSTEETDKEKLCDRVPASNDEASRLEHGGDQLRTVSASDVSSCSNEGPCKASEGNGNGNGNASASNTNVAHLPLHELILQAARHSHDPLLSRYIDIMKGSGASLQETQVGALLFHDMDMSDKFELIFSILADQLHRKSSGNEGRDDHNQSEKVPKDLRLHRNSLESLFRSIVMAISSCIQQSDSAVRFDMDKSSEVPERPTKRVKIEHMSPNSSATKTTVASTVDQSVPPLQSPSPSFDCSLATLKDEDEKHTCFPDAARKEFDEIAIYAADRVLDFARRLGLSGGVSAETFRRWRNVEGGLIVPWLDLMHLSKWQSSMPASDSSPSIMPLSPSKEGINFLSTSDETHLLAALSPNLDPPTPPFINKAPVGRTVVSFDFTGSMPANQLKQDRSSFCISITEENLTTFRSLVHLTGLSARPSVDICRIILDSSSVRIVDGREMKVMSLDAFNKCLNKLIPSRTSKGISKLDLDIFSCFADFFGCFQNSGDHPYLKPTEADAQELAVGFCFLCAGKKSSKLATGFELLEGGKTKGMTVPQLTQYLRSYLTMLVGISVLTSSPEGVMQPKMSQERRSDILSAISNGAAWTLGHYLKTTGRDNAEGRSKLHSFEDFANWYTSGGFNVAPWLELLDLSKLLLLVGSPPSQMGMPSTSQPLPPFQSQKVPLPVFSPHRPLYNTPSTPYGAPSTSMPPEILYTFPLANQRSLVVLREDATYVRGVVEQLGLLSLSPEEIWSSLFNAASKKPIIPQYPGARPLPKSAITKALRVNKATFIECMEATLQPTISNKKRSLNGSNKSSSSSGAKEILVNFFHSFDLHQIDAVGLNELMGGITLLCGGKKSTKLSFAFGVFDRKNDQKPKKRKKSQPVVNSLGGEDLFLFLRSFLIVMFSCCRQSWDLSDDAVGRYIADTANMVTDDVMRYQWQNSKKDRIDFDEFGKWYNDGGFETAPWLELLDLKKWVLVDNFDKFTAPKPLTPKPATVAPLVAPLSVTSCPPAPSDEDMDPSFFDNDNGIMNMDSMDEMDMILMQQPSHDVDDFNRLARSFSFSPRQVRQAFPPTPRARPSPRESHAIKFHLVTDDDHGGYLISVSQKRIIHLRDILIASGLYKLSGEEVCAKLLGDSFESDEADKDASHTMTKDEFDAVMRNIIDSQNMSMDAQNDLSDILTSIFNSFDRDGNGSVDGLELACGFTVLCRGKKSDKLEYAFDVINREKKGNLSKEDMLRYLRSFLLVLVSLTTNPVLPSDPADDSLVTMGGTACDPSVPTLVRAVEAGSTWAVSQVFGNRLGGSNQDSLCFDDFAEWYTHVGYVNIPWLELLDLQKWAILDK